jgi:ABC-type glycerol-3-phosphate transport system substrate-binding protein
LESVTFLNFIDKAGARLIDDNLIPPAVTFTHPDTVSAVYWYVSLTQEHGVKPTFITNLTKASTTNPAWRQSLIDNNQAAMWSSSSFEANLTFNTSLRETEQGELRTGTLPLPTGMAEQISGGYQAINGYYISAGAQEKEACWEWLKFLSTQPSIISGFPARISVAESNVYYQQVGQERIEAYLSAMQQPNSNAYYRFNTERIEFGSPFIWLAQAYDQILTNNVSVEEALVRAQYLADIYRECILKNEVRPNRIDQQACLEETSSK